MGKKSYARLLDQSFQSVSIPFKGEPLAGLQIMGILETRALDFDHLIILSMNEGVFPKVPSQQSFIPYNLRKGFGLPTADHQDAISAYAFYRLIQRASKIRLLYHSAPANDQNGEISRFLSQLIYDPQFEPVRKSYTFSVYPQKVNSYRERTHLHCVRGTWCLHDRWAWVQDIFTQRVEHLHGLPR